MNAGGGGLVPVCHGIGQSLTAGWARLCWFWALYEATSPGDVLLEMPQKRLLEGGDERSENVQWTFSAKNARPVGGPGGRRCPAALARLDSGWHSSVEETNIFAASIPAVVFTCGLLNRCLTSRKVVEKLEH